jgi:hypothetical protein
VFSLASDPLTTAQRLHELTRQREHRDHQRSFQSGEGCGRLPCDTPEMFGDLSSEDASSVDGSLSPGLGALTSVTAPGALKRR